MKRAEIIVKGRVQRVGYRDTIDRLAYQHDLSGYVENLEDRTVKVVCEGEADAIEKFIEDIRIDKYPIKVRDVEVEYSEATGEFDYFEIVREEDFTKAVYGRMDVAAEYLGNIYSETKKVHEETKKVGEKVERNIEETRKVGEKVERNIEETKKVGEKVERNIDETRKVHEETRAFREDTVACFDRLDDKYHIVSENLVAMKQESIESRKELSRLVDHVCLLVKDHVEKEEETSSPNL